jgi:hypothetical protein
MNLDFECEQANRRVQAKIDAEFDLWMARWRLKFVFYRASAAQKLRHDRREFKVSERK